MVRMTSLELCHELDSDPGVDWHLQLPFQALVKFLLVMNDLIVCAIVKVEKKYPLYVLFCEGIGVGIKN